CDGGGSSCAGLGVSGTTYTPTSADATSTLRAVVTATNRYGSTQAVSDVTAPVAGSAAPPPVAPVSTSLPQISGTVQVGGAVTSTTGSWSGGPTSYSFQWQRCSSSGGSCVAISGASASSYTVAAGDA